MGEVRAYLFDDFKAFVFHGVIADAVSHLFKLRP